MTQVYTDPREPGAPQVGDLVAASDGGPPDSPGASWLVGRLDGYSQWFRAQYPWYVAKVYLRLARYPTPEELAAYQLSQGAP